MHRFHLPELPSGGSVIVLSPEESHHAVSVLRLKRGDAVELFDGKGKVLSGVVLDSKGGRLSVAPGKELSARQTSFIAVTLAAAVIKPERMELLIQKVSELGVAAIVPLVTERTVVKLTPERWQGKVERWRKIALESCKQCGRSDAPDVSETIRFDSFLGALKGFDAVFIPTLAVPGGSLYERLTALKPKKVAILIGPEGDFTPSEVEKALAAGAIPIDLGPLVLRSETASIYAVSCLNFFARDIQKLAIKN